MDTTEERTGSPPDPAGEPGEDYRRVRQLLLGGEQQQLSLLHHRLQEIQHLQQQLDERCQALQANELQLARRLSTIVQRGDEFVGQNLAAALQRRAEGNEQSREELVRALKVPVEESLRQSVSEDPARLGETLGPAVRTEVNRGLWEVLRGSGLQRLVRFREDGSVKLAWPIAIMISLLLAALTGWLVFSIKENLGLERAAEAIRSEPGIVVTGADNPFLGKPRISGLRDPLAPAAEDLLNSAGLRPENFTINLQPFQSVDTPYAHQREQNRVRDLEDVRRQMIDAIGGLTSANESIRERDLETFARSLFALKFPDAAGKATLEFKDDRWLLSGAVEEPLYSELVKRSPEVALPGGEIDPSGLTNATAQQFKKLSAEISGIRLIFNTGKPELAEAGIRQGEMLVELIREFDAENVRLERLPGSFAVHTVSLPGETVSLENGDLETGRIKTIETLLTEKAEIPIERILPGVLETTEDPEKVGAYVELIVPEI